MPEKLNKKAGVAFLNFPRFAAAHCTVILNGLSGNSDNQNTIENRIENNDLVQPHFAQLHVNKKFDPYVKFLCQTIFCMYAKARFWRFLTNLLVSNIESSP